MINGVEVQKFCHESQWGGRLDTLKLSKQQIIVPQPLGGYEYESIKSFQYTIPEMYTQFINSEFGYRQRLANDNRDMSLRRFRELICPCMTDAKQRDTADEIVAEFKHCLLTWDICMRKKNSNVRASIVKCQSTDCPQHKKGSSTANMYSLASKTPAHFMNYLLCPKIQRNELAIKVEAGPSTYTLDLITAKSNNISEVVATKAKQESDYWASGSKKGQYYYLFIYIIELLFL